MRNQYISDDTGLQDEAALLGVFFVAATVCIVVVMFIMLRS